MATKDELRPHTVSFTGHRIIQHGNIAERLDTLLIELCQQGFRFYGAGGALGFDTEAALAVIRAQKKYSHIKLILVLPFPGQAEKWSKEQQTVYEQIKQRAAKVKYTSERYTSDCFHIRNRALIEGSSLCVAYLCKPFGGTFFTVGYAREQGVRVINIAE